MKKFWKFIPFILGVVALDQWTKYLTVLHLKDAPGITFLPGILSFTYAENTGAAWSMLEGQQWFFILLFVGLTVLLLLEYFKFRMPFTALDRWFIAAVYAGGLGNVIDRIFRHFVVDMIKADFVKTPVFKMAEQLEVYWVDFPIFNVADCFISCGCIGLLISLVFFNKNFWKENKK